MANPRTDQGFVMIALDLWGALMAADLRHYEALIMAEAMAQCYGPSKRTVANLDPGCLSETTGASSKNMRKALKGLISAGILVRKSKLTYAIVKDYETWKPGGTGIKATLIEFARDFTSRFGSPWKRINASKPVGVQADSRDQSDNHLWESRQTPLTIVKESNETPKQLSKESAWTPITVDESPPTEDVTLMPVNGCDVGLACASARPSEEFRLEIKKSFAEPREETPTAAPQEGKKGPQECPPIPDPDGLHYVHPGKHAHTPEEAAALFRLAWALAPGTSIAFEFWEHQRWYTPDVWRAAIRKAAKAKHPVRSIGYVETIAAEYASTGIPVSRPISGPISAARAAPGPPPGGYHVAPPKPPKPPQASQEPRGAIVVAPADVFSTAARGSLSVAPGTSWRAS